MRHRVRFAANRHRRNNATDASTRSRRCARIDANLVQRLRHTVDPHARAAPQRDVGPGLRAVRSSSDAPANAERARRDGRSAARYRQSRRRYRPAAVRPLPRKVTRCGFAVTRDDFETRRFTGLRDDVTPGRDAIAAAERPTRRRAPRCSRSSRVCVRSDSPMTTKPGAGRRVLNDPSTAAAAPDRPAAHTGRLAARRPRGESEAPRARRPRAGKRTRRLPRAAATRGETRACAASIRHAIRQRTVAADPGLDRRAVEAQTQHLHPTEQRILASGLRDACSGPVTARSHLEQRRIGGNRRGGRPRRCFATRTAHGNPRKTRGQREQFARSGASRSSAARLARFGRGV